MSEFLKVCVLAARAGGEVLLDWAGRFEVRKKAPKDLVTEADLASQDTIRRILLEAFPDHGFVGEEDRQQETSAATYRWIPVRSRPAISCSTGRTQHLARISSSSLPT